MKDYPLKDIEYFDLVDFINRVERSFNIKLEDNELSHIHTFKELCSHIINKIQLDNSDDCTSQQAFYKLRNTISSEFQLDKRVILPEAFLADILPKDKRVAIKKIEEKLGLKLNVLRPPNGITIVFIIIFFISLFVGYFNWQVGLLGIILTMGGFWFSNKTGSTLETKTVRDLVTVMVRENYLKSRRTSVTVNNTEAEKVLTDWFVEEFDIFYGK